MKIGIPKEIKDHECRLFIALAAMNCTKKHKICRALPMDLLAKNCTKSSLSKEGAVQPPIARTATIALTNSVLPYALKIAKMGYQEALLTDPLLSEGLNVCLGKVTNKYVADGLGYEYHKAEEAFSFCEV